MAREQVAATPILKRLSSPATHMIPTPRLGWSVATNIISPRLAIGSHTSDSCLVNMMKMMDGGGEGAEAVQC